MSITKKHFIKIAEIVRQNNGNDKLINDFSTWLKTLNGLFDEEKFKSACINK